MTIIHNFDSISVGNYKILSALTVIPIGGIIYWTTSNSPPTGWAICDGTNGTIDLRSKFIVGKDNSDVLFNSIGNTGGSKRVTLTINEIPSHSHLIQNNIAIYNPNYQNFDSDNSTSGYYTPTRVTGYTGGSNSHNNVPPYYVLCYIMRIY